MDYEPIRVNAALQLEKAEVVGNLYTWSAGLTLVEGWAKRYPEAGLEPVVAQLQTGWSQCLLSEQV